METRLKNLDNNSHRRETVLSSEKVRRTLFVAFCSFQKCLFVHPKSVFLQFTDLCRKGKSNTQSDICKNGGTCVDGINTYTCHCTEGFTGVNCEAISACASNPCLNGGVCTESQNSYSCDCGSDYDGNRCQHGKLRFSDSLFGGHLYGY